VPLEDAILALLSHSRFLATLRSCEGKYHSLIIFRLSTSKDIAGSFPGASDSTSQNDEHSQLYAMEAQCPHLGADISHADIEECDNGLVLVCPWHRYDFDLRTGQSETGLKACTYPIEINPGPDGTDEVWLEAPEGGTDWKLVELRPVSEAFADPPPPSLDLSHLSLVSENTDSPATSIAQEEDVVPKEGAPTTLVEWAVLVLKTADPVLKVQRTRHAVNLFRTGQLKSIGHRSANAPRPPEEPPRVDAYTRNTVEPSKIGKRRNRGVMLHALANIEQWA